MKSKQHFTCTGVLFFLLAFSSCSVPYSVRKNPKILTPTVYRESADTGNIANLPWKTFYTDPDLAALIDTALKNNQEYAILMSELQISKNEVLARKGAYQPSMDLMLGAGVDKSSRYTRNGAVEANTDILPGKKFPEPLPDLGMGLGMQWELDIWKRLRNAKKSAMHRYLASVEGRNFMVTNLISEIAGSYYELMALDNQLSILKKNIQIQQDALEIVRLEKQAAAVTELAVRKFEAEVFKNQSRQFDLMQKAVECENRINFLVGRSPQHIARNADKLNHLTRDTVLAGLPAQLLDNRPDIRQASEELEAARVDVASAKARFYPSLILRAELGYGAFNPQYLLNPESLLCSMLGRLAAPLINRKEIKAVYYTANSKQVQAIYRYEQRILNAYVEVSNQLSKLDNLQNSYAFKAKQVEALSCSTDISAVLFKAARADYMEVLMTQRDVLEARFDLVETRQELMNAHIGLYKALGGGWR